MLARTPPSVRPEHRPREDGDHVDPQGLASLLLGERVREDGRAVREEERGAHPLDYPEDDELEGPGVARCSGVR